MNTETIDFCNEIRLKFSIFKSTVAVLKISLHVYCIQLVDAYIASLSKSFKEKRV